MENDPEATDKDNKEDTEAWLNYMQSQQTSRTQSQQASQSQISRSTQLRPYKLPYLTQDPTYPQSNITTPRYQATASQAAAQAPQSPPQNTIKDKEEITPPPCLRVESEIDNIGRASGGVFITYNYNILIRYLKEPAFTKTLVNTSLQYYNLWRL